LVLFIFSQVIKTNRREIYIKRNPTFRFEQAIGNSGKKKTPSLRRKKLAEHDSQEDQLTPQARETQTCNYVIKMQRELIENVQKRC